MTHTPAGRRLRRRRCVSHPTAKFTLLPSCLSFVWFSARSHTHPRLNSTHVQHIYSGEAQRKAQKNIIVIDFQHPASASVSRLQFKYRKSPAHPNSLLRNQMTSILQAFLPAHRHTHTHIYTQIYFCQKEIVIKRACLALSLLTRLHTHTHTCKRVKSGGRERRTKTSDSNRPYATFCVRGGKEECISDCCQR